MKRVLIEPADYGNVNRAVDRAFDCFPLAITGKKVLIKPNVLRASEAHEGIVTHPFWKPWYEKCAPWVRPKS